MANMTLIDHIPSSGTPRCPSEPCLDHLRGDPGAASRPPACGWAPGRVPRLDARWELPLQCCCRAPSHSAQPAPAAAL